MEPATFTACANCGKHGTMRCAGCISAPEYSPGDSTFTAYCNRDCQKNHWPNHKPRCRALKQRKNLLRIAKLLKATLLKYREVVFDLDFSEMEFKDGVLYLHRSQPSLNTVPKRSRFPDHLTNDSAHKEAALTLNQCSMAMSLSGPMSRRLLQGKPNPPPDNSFLHINKS